MNILFDIGASKTRVAAARNDGTFGKPTIYKTPEKYEEGVVALCKVAREAAGNETITAVGGGVKGPIDHTSGILLHPARLEDWRGKPFRDRLRQELQAPIYIDNDTAVVGLGEATAGAGRNHKIVVYVTVSTGVGGVRIVQEKIDTASIGFEIGHHIINMSEMRHCTCTDQPTFGHVESYISGAGFTLMYGKSPFEVVDDAVWSKAARELAILFNNVITFWSPNIIVVGGSMIVGIKGPVIPLDEAIAFLKSDVLTILPEPPKIVPADLGDFGGLHGALALICQHNISK